MTAGAVLLTIALLGVLVSVGANHVLVPAAAERGAARLSDVCGCRITVSGARFVRFGSLELDGVRISELHSPVGARESIEVRADTVVVSISAVEAIRLWRKLKDTGVHRDAVRRARAYASGGYPMTAGWILSEAVATAGLIPSRVEVKGLSVTRSDRDASSTKPAPSSGSPPGPVEVDFLVVHHDPHERQLSLRGKSGPDPTVSARITADYSSRIARGSISARGIDLSSVLAAMRGPRGAAPVSGTLRFGAGFSVSGRSVESVIGHFQTTDLLVYLPVLSPLPIDDVELRYDFEGSYRPEAPPHVHTPAGVLPGGEVTVERGSLQVNGVEVAVRGKLAGVPLTEPHPTSGLPAYVPRYSRIEIDLPETPVETLHRAIPSALLGPLEHARASGTFSWALELEVPRWALGELQWRAEPRLQDFEVYRLPSQMSPYKLNDAFFHTIRDENVGFTRTIRIPPAQPVSVEWLAEHAERSMEEAREMLQRRSESPPAPRGAREPSLQLPDPTYRYVRLEDMSPWVVRAVLTAEDGDFFFHDGVNFYTLPRALARNLRAGEIRYGASTISMQVVKMLFLEDDRVVSRKLQEVLLVYLMEHEVPVSKPRILEIYLNIAEFGPGVFGISDAARYYFGKSPADLDTGEAVWLASILPSPKRYHRYYERGGISDGWFERMKSYFDVMLERERMSEDEHEQAVAEKPTFEK